MDSEMNPAAMSVINPRKEYWPSQGLNQQSPVLKSALLPPELWCLATKILDWSYLKVIADNIKISEKLKFVLGWVENIIGNGENTDSSL